MADDFLDSFYLPAEYLCTISKENAEILNTALKGKIKFRPSLKRLLSIFKEDISEVYLPETKTAKKEVKDTVNAKLIAKTKRYRYIKHHFTQISFAVLAIVLVAGITISLVNSELNRPTTKGLTSVQVVESFYTSLNRLETVKIEECISKSAGKQITNIAANLYVTNKMQAAYNRGMKYYTPAQWIAEGTPDRSSIYGITQLKINGIESTANADWLENNLKIPLEDVEPGAAENFSVEYYIVMTEDPETLTAIKYKDSVALTFVKDKWIITKLERDGISYDYDKAQFIQDLSENKTDSYPWYPTQKEFEAAKAELAAQAAIF